MSKDRATRAMTRVELEDEVMLLRAQVKVLQDWIRLAKRKAGQAAPLKQAITSLDECCGLGSDCVG